MIEGSGSRAGSGLGSDPDPDPGGPKTCGSQNIYQEVLYQKDWSLYFGAHKRNLQFLPVKKEDPDSMNKISTEKDWFQIPNKEVQCWRSVTFWCGSGSSDPHLGLVDQDPTPDSTPLFSDFEEQNNFFKYFFLITNPQARVFSPKFEFFAKILC